MLTQMENGIFVKSGIEWWEWTRAGSIVALTFFLAYLSRRFVRHTVGRNDAANSIGRLVARLVTGVIILFGVLYALSTIGVRVAPLLGVLGIGGVAFALAFQDILENFISGIFLQLQRSFIVGDQILTNEYEGSVEDVNLRNVLIRTYDGELVVIPNALVYKNLFVNRTDRKIRRTTLVVGVGYGSNLSQAEQVLLGALCATEGVQSSPSPEALVQEFGASSIDFILHFWHEASMQAHWTVRHKVALNVQSALREAGIEIPFPQRTLSFSPETARVFFPPETQDVL